MSKRRFIAAAADILFADYDEVCTHLSSPSVAMGASNQLHVQTVEYMFQNEGPRSKLRVIPYVSGRPMAHLADLEGDTPSVISHMVADIQSKLDEGWELSHVFVVELGVPGVVDLIEVGTQVDQLFLSA